MEKSRKDLDGGRLLKVYTILDFYGICSPKKGWRPNAKLAFIALYIGISLCAELAHFLPIVADGRIEMPQDVEMLTFVQTHAITFYRIYMMIRHKGKFAKLAEFVSDELSSWIYKVGDMRRSLIESCKRGRWLFWFYGAQVSIVGSMLIIRPLLSSEPHALLMRSQVGRLPYLPIDQSPFYQITYSLQMLYIIIAIGIAFCTNMLFFTLSTRVCAYTEYLAIDIEYTNKNTRAEDTAETIKIFVDRYNKIREFVNTLSVAFTVLMSIQPIYTGFSVITSMLVFDGTEQSYSFMAFAVAHTFEFYIFCYAGDMITEQSSALSDKIFASNWYEFSQSNKKSVLQILQQCRRPFAVKAGIFGTFSMEMFSETMKMTYSIWAVVNQTK